MMFQMAGRIDECFLLWYAIDPRQAAALVPARLEPVTCRGAAFVSIAVCHVDRMRPRFAPRAMGVTYWYIAYRIRVRAALNGGDSIEGLYFLRSDVNRRLLGTFGNRLTDFHFHAADVRFSPEGEGWTLRVVDASHDGDATLLMHRAGADGLMPRSPFSSIGERERVLKYAPFGLSVSSSGRSLRVTEVIRDESRWRETPIQVAAAAWNYPRTIGVADLHLVRATRVAPIDYVWRIGRTENLGAMPHDASSRLVC